MTPAFAQTDVCLPDLIPLHARFLGKRPALIEGDRVLDWAGFAAAVDSAASALQAAGLRPGDAAAILSRTCAEAVIWQFGVLRAGGMVAAISTAVTDEAIAGMINNCGADIVIADAETSVRIAPAEGRVLLRADMSPEPAAVRPPLPVLSGEATLSIMYSSGTTGQPKGIVLSHRCRMDYARIMAASLRFTQESVALVTTALCSNMTWTLLQSALSQGACTVLMDRFSPGAFLEVVARRRVTHTIMVPTQFQRILEHPGAADANLGSFVAACSVGSAMAPGVKARVAALFQGAFHEIYGMTEGFATVLYPDELAEKSVTVGRPMPGNDVRIVGPDEREAPLGAPGEIVARSPMLMAGYHNDPAQTEAATWVNPADGARFLRSGDIGQVDQDGFIALVGRKKDMIISGGQNIYPADLERVLSEHPEVSEAAVIGIPHADWGETPLGLVVLAPGASPSAEDLRLWANERLGRQQRLSAVEIRPSLPRNDGGKVVKTVLRAPYWEGR